MLQFFFNSLARSSYLSFFSLSFNFILWSAGTVESTIRQVLFFVIDYYNVWSSGRIIIIIPLYNPPLSLFLSYRSHVPVSQLSLCIILFMSFPIFDSLLCIFLLFFQPFAHLSGIILSEFLLDSTLFFGSLNKCTRAK